MKVKFYSLDDQGLEVLAEIEKELNIYREDGKCIKFTIDDVTGILNRIAFVMQNNRCVHCEKLITMGDVGNFECGGCGFSLSETLSQDSNPESKK